MSVHTITICDWCGEEIDAAERPAAVHWSLGGIGEKDVLLMTKLVFHAPPAGAALRGDIRPDASCYGLFVASVRDRLDATDGDRQRVEAQTENTDAELDATGEPDAHAAGLAPYRWTDVMRAWRRSDAFREILDSYAGVPIHRQATHALADAGIDLKRARTMSDDDLSEAARQVSGKYLGLATLAKLRAHTAQQDVADVA